ncbi:MAG: hypothetical protein ICV55_16875 [Coleofasciculus sp. C3-bin4]|nr:hypothetical protein [Coleofasciculus sp. C3-bin4]
MAWRRTGNLRKISPENSILSAKSLLRIFKGINVHSPNFDWRSLVTVA